MCDRVEIKKLLEGGTHPIVRDGSYRSVVNSMVVRHCTFFAEAAANGERSTSFILVFRVELASAIGADIDIRALSATVLHWRGTHPAKHLAIVKK